MSEEKKETNPEKIEAPEAAKPAEESAPKKETIAPAAPEPVAAPKVEATAPAAPEPVAAPKTEVPVTAAPEQTAAPKQEEPKKEPEPVKKEKPSNCADCKKPIRKKRWYYRDGLYYCSKRCWHTKVDKEKPKDAGEGQTPAQAAA